jgi:hypothetical protein
MINANDEKTMEGYGTQVRFGGKTLEQHRQGGEGGGSLGCMGHDEELDGVEESIIGGTMGEWQRKAKMYCSIRI